MYTCTELVHGAMSKIGLLRIFLLYFNLFGHFEFEMAAMHERGKNADNSILVGEVLKRQNSNNKKSIAEIFARAIF